MEWKQKGKRHESRSSKRWQDAVEDDLKALGMQEWKEIVQDRKRWKDVLMVAKTLIELDAVEEDLKTLGVREWKEIVNRVVNSSKDSFKIIFSSLYHYLVLIQSYHHLLYFKVPRLFLFP